MTTRPPRKTRRPLPVEAGSEFPFGQEVSQEIDFLVDLLNLSPDESILDIASGAGHHALELARRGYRKVTAVDLSDQLLDIGSRTAASSGLKVRFLKGDPRKLPFDEQFDAMLVLGGGAFGIMETDEENQQILDAAFRRLRPGGRIALTAMNLLWLVRTARDLSGYDPTTGYLTTTETVQVEGDGTEELPLHERYYVFPLLKRQLEQAGFRNILGFGAAPGRFSSRSITVEDPEILAYGVKPRT